MSGPTLFGIRTVRDYGQGSCVCESPRARKNKEVGGVRRALCLICDALRFGIVFGTLSTGWLREDAAYRKRPDKKFVGKCSRAMSLEIIFKFLILPLGGVRSIAN